jgi:hypothetical protein
MLNERRVSLDEASGLLDPYLRHWPGLIVTDQNVMPLTEEHLESQRRSFGTLSKISLRELGLESAFRRSLSDTIAALRANLSPGQTEAEIVEVLRSLHLDFGTIEKGRVIQARFNPERAWPGLKDGFLEVRLDHEGRATSIVVEEQVHSW